MASFDGDSEWHEGGKGQKGKEKIQKDSLVWGGVLKCGLRIAVSPEYVSEMQVIGPYSRLLNQKVWRCGPEN